MNESLLNRILKDHKRRTRSLALILCLSMIVSLGTFAGFHQTAIAKVYTREVLDCPYTHEGAEPVAHVHNDDCYDGGTLVCTLPERDAHMHDDTCYAESRMLICGLEENPGHQHSEACFDENGELICQIPEGEGAHAHTDDCYTIERALICNQPELPVHVHDAGCFRTEEITVDEPEETAASEQAVSTVPEMPVSDPNADLETVDDWNCEFENLEFSGNWARDLVLVAATQQGRGESPNNFEAVLNDAGDAWVRHGYTRYGAWYGYPYAEWDAMFVSFCLRYAGIPVENVPNNPTAAFMAESFSMGGLFAGRDYVPAVGDLIFFDTVVDDEITSIDHMGIVYHVDAENGTINTVEGDRTDTVATFGYYLNDEQIVGYGILPQNPNYVPSEEENTDNTDEAYDGFIFITTDEEEEPEETPATEDVTVPAVPMPAQSWERTAGGIKVSVEAPEGAFPENTRIAVTPVNGSSLKDTVSDAVDGEVLEVQAVDITFFDAEGREIEPAIPIRVVMTPAATQHAEEKTSVVHVDVAQQTAELIEQAEGTETDNSEVVFDAEAFTIYAIVYTVDYEYEVDGNVYQYSMEGGSSIALSELIELLRVNQTSYTTAQFLEQIQNVSFTSPELLEVVRSGSDWILNSLQPFNTYETLTVTMVDGQQFAVRVTDAATSSDLRAFLDSFDIVGVEKNGEGKYVVKNGVPYNLQLNFSEKVNGAQFQEGTLTYSFPNGFEPQDISGNVEMTGPGGPVSFHYSVSGNSLTVTFDQNSEGYQAFLNSETAQFEIHVTGVINQEEISFSDSVTGNFDIDTTAGVGINKTGTYHQDTNQIEYKVYATASGNNTNVHIGDKISGTALTFDSTKGVTVSSNKNGSVAYNNDTRSGETFGITIPSMQNGETVTLVYYADVDLAKVGDNGQGSIGTVEQTGNTVKVTSSEDNEGSQSQTSGKDLQNKISISSIDKKAGEPADLENGKKEITWTVTLNENANVSLGGKSITDTIAPESQSIMRYTGSGIHVDKYNKDGTLAGEYDVLWGNNNLSSSSSGSTWTYIIPETDTDNYKYVITYKTEVDADKLLQQTTVHNSISDDYGTHGGSANVEPTGETVSAEKKALTSRVDASRKEASTEWEISFTVPKAGLSSAVVTDTLPTAMGYCDSLVENSVNVSGKLDGENFTVEPAEDGKSFTVTFSKTENGVTSPGLLPSTVDRTISIRFTTQASQDWLVWAESNSWARKHQNKADIWLNGQKFEKSAEVTYNTTELDLEKSQFGTYATNTDPSLPIYQYQIILTGVNEEAFDENGCITVTDNYDSGYLVYQTSYATNNTANVNDPNGYVYGSGQYNKGNMVNKGPYVVDDSSTPGTLIFKLHKDNLPKDNSAYYTYYEICYALQVKDADALERLQSTALQKEGARVELVNVVSNEDFGTAEVKTYYTVDILEKSKVAEADNTSTGTHDISFKIEVNKDQLKIGDEDTITLTDTLTNLSVDYTTIQVEPALEDDVVDRKNNKVLFTLHNQTHYTITYTTRLIGLSNVQWKNEAEIKGQVKSNSGTASTSSGGSGSYTTFSMKVQKYERGNLNKALQASFELYEARVRDDSGQEIANPEWKKIGEFITDENTGVFDITSVVRDGESSSLREYSHHDENGQEVFDRNNGWQYKIIETQAPEGYQLKESPYIFGISDQPDYNNYVYLNNDVVTVPNDQKPKTGMSVVKTWKNLDDTTTWPEGQEVSFTLKKLAADGSVSALTQEDLGDAWSRLESILTQTITENPASTAELWPDLPELAAGAVYVVEEAPISGYDVYSKTADGSYVKTNVAQGIDHVASFRNENNIIPIDEETQLRLTVEKNWQDKDGNPVTENLPENVPFTLERDRSYRIPNGNPVTDVTLVVQTSNNRNDIFHKYSFERGSTATIMYEYTEDFGKYGSPGYRINEDPEISLQGIPSGTITVQIPQSGSAVVTFQEGWNGTQLNSASATGTLLVNYDYHNESDTAYNTNPDTITVTAADMWTGSAVLPKTETIDNIQYTYTYKVKEIELPGWNVSYSENNETGLAESGTVTVTNKDSRVDVTATKQWADQTGQAEWPEGVTVTVTLSRSDDTDGSASPAEIYKDGALLTEDERKLVLSKDQPSAAWENLAGLPEGVSYVVTETAVTGGTISGNQITIGDKVYFSSVQKNGNDYVITNSDTVDVKLLKTWDENITGDMYWEAEFILEELEYPYTPNFDDRKAHDDAGHNGRWTPVSPEVRWSISKSSGDELPTLHNLPRFRVKDDGKTYILMYSVSEVAYSVWDSSEKTNLLYSWTKGGSYTGNIHFTPEYLEDADTFTNYTIEVLNSEKNEQESVFIDFDLKKSWLPVEDSAADSEDSYAKFVLKRVSHKEFKKLNDPEVDYGQFVTVKLVDGAGREITSLEVEKNAQIKLQAGFKAGADGVGSVDFENILGSTGHIYINNTSENPTQMLVASEPFRVDTDATYQYVSGERYLADGIYGVVISDRCDGTPETEHVDQDFSMKFTINKNTGYVVTYDKENKTYTTQQTSDGWTLSFVGLPQSMVDTGASQETTTIYGYYFEETESQPNYKHVTFYQADSQGNKTSVINGDRDNRIYFDDHVIAENRKSHLTIKKYWESQVQAEMPNVVVDIKQVPTGNACGINDGAVDSAPIYRRVILCAANNFEYDLYDLEVDLDPNDPNNRYYAYVPVEMGFTTNKPGDPGVLEDGTVEDGAEIEILQLDSRVSEKVSYLAAQEGDEIDYKKIKTKYEFYEKMGNIPDNIRQPVVRNGTGTICIVNWPKKTGYQMAIRKRWHKFTTDGGMTTESDYNGAYFTAMLVQIIKDPANQGKEITRIDYGDMFEWRYDGNPTSPGKNKWSYKDNGTNVTIDYRNGQWLVVFPEGGGDDGSNLPMYGYYEVTDDVTGEKTRKLVEYDYTVREISVTSTDGYHWAISDHIQEASAQDVTDSGLNENDHVWMLDNYPDADLKIIKHWPTESTNQDTDKVYFKITDSSKITETNPTNNVIERIVGEKSYAEHAITASDVEYLEEYGWCFVVRGRSNSTDDWANYIDHLPLFDFSTTHFTDGPMAKKDMPGELNYNVEEVAVRKIDGTLVSSGKLYIPYYEVTTRGTKGSIRSSADGIQLGMYDTEKGELQPTIVEVTNNANTNLKVEKRFYEKDQNGRTVQVNPAETTWKDEDGAAISSIQYVVQVDVIKNTERTDNGKIVVDSETDTKYLVAFDNGNLTLADDKEAAHKYVLNISQDQEDINTDHYGVYWKDQPLELQGLPSVAISTDGTNPVVTQYSYSIEETAVLLENGQVIGKFVKDSEYDEENEVWLLSNTREKIEYTDFIFTKEWQNALSEEVQTWPSGKQIEVEVYRSKNDSIDEDFLLKYKITSENYNSSNGITAETGSKYLDGQTTPLLKYVEGTKYQYTLNNLIRKTGEAEYEYYVKETNTVDGYAQARYYHLKDGSLEPLAIGAANGDHANNGGKILNKETSGYELPQTGGIGTTLFTALGGFMTATAGVILTIRRKRKPAEG